MTTAPPALDGVERRAVHPPRVAGRRLSGYAAVFGAEARIGAVTETIRPGAFAASLASARDVLALIDHDPHRLLGRTRTGTLRLWEDTHGLGFDLDLPATTAGADILALAERGDLGGMSFAFIARDEGWPARDRRELRSVDLIEVSVVQAHPAYSATEIHARARDGAPPRDRAARLARLRTIAL